MNLQYRINLLLRLKEYILSNDDSWQNAKEKAHQKNSWFIPEFIDLAIRNISQSFLVKKTLENWVSAYQLSSTNEYPKTIGIVMAGNIPLVGFHDLLSVFVSGHKALVKLSSKDETLIKHLADKLNEWSLKNEEMIGFADMLKNCDAYIATGSNNSSRYFEYYFGKYPHIIRRNRTSLAILTGDETNDELEKFADDVYQYFGMGCRNVSKIYVPKDYDFIPLLHAFKKYNYLADYNKYKNNYDYNLAIHILNKKHYMANDSILLVEEASLFSRIGQLNYEYYNDFEVLLSSLKNNLDIQCIVGRKQIPFGQSQCPSVNDYADGIDTMAFLKNL